MRSKVLQPRQSPSPSPRDTCGCRGTPLPKTKLDDGEASATGKGATPGQRGAAFRATARLSLRALLLNYGAGGHGEAHSWSHTGATSPCSPTRWLKKDVKSTDDLRAIVQRLSAFGPVRSVALCGRQSAVVVFEGTVSACNAVSAFPRRTPDTVFQCSWQQRLMSRDVSEAPCDQTPRSARVASFISHQGPRQIQSPRAVPSHTNGRGQVCVETGRQGSPRRRHSLALLDKKVMAAFRHSSDSHRPWSTRHSSAFTAWSLSLSAFLMTPFEILMA